MAGYLFVVLDIILQRKAEKIHNWLLSQRFKPIWSLEDAEYLLFLPKGNYKKEDLEWLMHWDSEIFAK